MQTASANQHAAGEGQAAGDQRQSRIVREDRDGVHVLTLSRPEVLNAIDASMVEELDRVLDACAADGRPLIFTGAGRAFCAGGDLKGYLALIDDPAGMRRYFDRLRQTFVKLADYPGVTIAALNGVTVAGGLELACLCDLAIAAEGARIADGHINYGLNPGGGASAVLTRMIGERRARWLLLSGQFIDAHEAQCIGLVNRIVPADRLMAQAVSMAQIIAGHAPAAVRRLKRLMGGEVQAMLRAEHESLLELFREPEIRDRLRGFADRSRRLSFTPTQDAMPTQET